MLSKYSPCSFHNPCDFTHSSLETHLPLVIFILLTLHLWWQPFASNRSGRNKFPKPKTLLYFHCFLWSLTGWPLQHHRLGSSTLLKISQHPHTPIKQRNPRDKRKWVAFIQESGNMRWIRIQEEDKRARPHLCKRCKSPAIWWPSLVRCHWLQVLMPSCQSNNSCLNSTEVQIYSLIALG